MKPINLCLDVLLKKTLNNKMAFKIEAVLADLKICDLTALSSIITSYSVPVFVFTKGVTPAQDFVAKYPNIIPIFYDYGVNILIEFLLYYRFTIITILCDSEAYSLSFKDAVTKQIKDYLDYSFVSPPLALSIRIIMQKTFRIK